MAAAATEIALILLLLVANGVFAMSEIAIVTARRSRLERLASGGDARARAALELSRDPAQFLSTVQVGITLVGILAGAFGGANLTVRLAIGLEGVSWLAPYADVTAFTLVVGTITFLSVIIGELVPKRVALGNPERIAAIVARPMQILARIGSPIVSLLTTSTNALFKLLPVADASEQSVTEEDIRALVAQATATGAVHERERQIVERVLRLEDRPVSAVMTPRPDIDWIDIAKPEGTLRDQLKTGIRSRFLVCEGSLDKVVGVIRANDLLARCLDEAPLELGPHLRQPLFVPSTMPVLRLLETFRTADVHVAVVLDEFGSLKGIATLNDIFGDLVATMPGPKDDVDSDIVRRADGSWLVDGTVPIEDLEGQIGMGALSVNGRTTYRTLGGLVMTQLGHVPRVGEHFTAGGFRFDVMDMDGRRIDRVLVTRRTGDGG